jgi:hypothetical protein
VSLSHDAFGFPTFSATMPSVLPPPQRTLRHFILATPPSTMLVDPGLRTRSRLQNPTKHIIVEHSSKMIGPFPAKAQNKTKALPVIVLQPS